MAAVNPIGAPGEKPSVSGSRLINFVKLAIILIIVGGSVWLLAYRGLDVTFWGWYTPHPSP